MGTGYTLFQNVEILSRPAVPSPATRGPFQGQVASTLGSHPESAFTDPKTSLEVTGQRQPQQTVTLDKKDGVEKSFVAKVLKGTPTL